MNNYEKHNCKIFSSFKAKKLLSEIGIETFKGSGNVVRVKVSKDELVNVYTKRNWITEFDEFNSEAVKVPDELKVDDIDLLGADIDMIYFLYLVFGFPVSQTYSPRWYSVT